MKKQNVTVTTHGCTDNSCLHFDGLISFEIIIARNYKFLHGITHSCTELQRNWTALDQSESSNFFMIMIIMKMLIIALLTSDRQRK